MLGTQKASPSRPATNQATHKLLRKRSLDRKCSSAITNAVTARQRHRHRSSSSKKSDNITEQASQKAVNTNNSVSNKRYITTQLLESSSGSGKNITNLLSRAESAQKGCFTLNKNTPKRCKARSGKGIKILQTSTQQSFRPRRETKEKATLICNPKDTAVTSAPSSVENSCSLGASHRHCSGVKGCRKSGSRAPAPFDPQPSTARVIAQRPQATSHDLSSNLRTHTARSYTPGAMTTHVRRTEQSRTIVPHEPSSQASALHTTVAHHKSSRHGSPGTPSTTKTALLRQDSIRRAYSGSPSTERTAVLRQDSNRRASSASPSTANATVRPASPGSLSTIKTAILQQDSVRRSSAWSPLVPHTSVVHHKSSRHASPSAPSTTKTVLLRQDSIKRASTARTTALRKDSVKRASSERPPTADTTVVHHKSSRHCSPGSPSTAVVQEDSVRRFSGSPLAPHTNVVHHKSSRHGSPGAPSTTKTALLRQDSIRRAFSGSPSTARTAVLRQDSVGRASSPANTTEVHHKSSRPASPGSPSTTRTVLLRLGSANRACPRRLPCVTRDTKLTRSEKHSRSPEAIAYKHSFKPGTAEHIKRHPALDLSGDGKPFKRKPSRRQDVEIRPCLCVEDIAMCAQPQQRPTKAEETPLGATIDVARAHLKGRARFKLKLKKKCYGSVNLCPATNPSLRPFGHCHQNQPECESSSNLTAHASHSLPTRARLSPSSHSEPLSQSSPQLTLSPASTVEAAQKHLPSVVDQTKPTQSRVLVTLMSTLSATHLSAVRVYLSPSLKSSTDYLTSDREMPSTNNDRRRKTKKDVTPMTSAHLQRTERSPHPRFVGLKPKQRKPAGHEGERRTQVGEPPTYTVDGKSAVIIFDKTDDADGQLDEERPRSSASDVSDQQFCSCSDFPAATEAQEGLSAPSVTALSSDLRPKAPKRNASCT